MKLDGSDLVVALGSFFFFFLVGEVEGEFFAFALGEERRFPDLDPIFVSFDDGRLSVG